MKRRNFLQMVGAIAGAAAMGMKPVETALSDREKLATYEVLEVKPPREYFIGVDVAGDNPSFCYYTLSTGGGGAYLARTPAASRWIPAAGRACL